MVNHRIIVFILLLYCALKMRLHELLMDMITERNYGVPIPLSHDDHSSHMDDIHTEMEKRLIVFLALPGILFFNYSITKANHKTIK